MRTHARYELQDSISLEEAAAGGAGPHESDSAQPTFSGQGPGRGPIRLSNLGSRCSQPVSCESVNLPHTQSRPMSFMDTGEGTGYEHQPP